MAMNRPLIFIAATIGVIAVSGALSKTVTQKTSVTQEVRQNSSIEQSVDRSPNKLPSEPIRSAAPTPQNNDSPDRLDRDSASSSDPVQNEEEPSQENADMQRQSSNSSSSWSSASSSSSVRVSGSSQSGQSFQRQQSTIALDAAKLRESQTLNITAPNNTQLSGQIRIDGVVIQELKGSQTSLNVAPYLGSGNKIIEISGRYSPASAPLRIELVGSGSQVVQQTQGNGLLNHTIKVVVR